ncbi:MAG: tRNA lysidine(34) synthetase TilS [Pseudomonadota bacterium]
MQLTWPIPADEPAAIAVSGGADSFALLHWAHARGYPIVALTVDHGLRPESAGEAVIVADWCRVRRIEHETLVWEGEKPKTGIQEAARNARYRLLCEACERRGIKHLFTGHTADDQAETVFMRLRRGAGRGLAGMPAERKIAAGPGELVTLHRAMLGVRRGEARSYAEAQDLSFIDDPSNDDEAYERVRIRALLAALEQQELLIPSDLQSLADFAASTQRVEEQWCEERTWQEWWHFTDPEAPHDYFSPHLLSAHDTMSTDGGCAVSAGLLSDPPSQAMLLRVIGALGNHRPRSWTLVADALPTVIEGVMLQTFKYQVSVQFPALNDNRVDEAVAIFREPAALLGRADGTPGFAPVPAPPGSKHLFDRRFIVEVPDDAPEGLELRALGQLLPKDIATSTLARQRIATLPALAMGDQLTHLPEQATEAVTSALSGWKACDGFLSTLIGTFPARSLLAERFAGDVIRF